MLDIQQKRKLRFVMYHKYTLIALSILVVIFMHSTWAIYNKKTESELLMDSSEQRLLDLQTREKDLKEKIDKLNTEQGIEEEIRSKFNVTKENENVVIIVENKEKEASTTDEKVSFWQRIKSFMGL